MKVIIQRVNEASVVVDGVKISSIEKGLLVLLGVCEGDTESEMKYLADKTHGLRIFSDENDKMNKSVSDIGGEILVVPNFTLYGDCSRGKRPNFMRAAKPEVANELYEKFKEYLISLGVSVKSGEFGADMKVNMQGDGPVTIVIESP